MINIISAIANLVRIAKFKLTTSELLLIVNQLIEFTDVILSTEFK